MRYRSMSGAFALRYLRANGFRSYLFMLFLDSSLALPGATIIRPLRT